MATPFLVVLLSLLFVNVFAGLLPLFLARAFTKCGLNRSRIVAFFLQIGAGSLFAICMFILLPECRLHFEERISEEESTELCPIDGEAIPEESHKDEFPIPEFILLCGFLATFTIEEVLKVLLSCRKREDTKDPRVRFCSCAKRHTECSRTFKCHNPEQTLFGLERQSTSDNNEESLGFAHRPTEQITNTNLLQSSILSQPVPNYGTVTATNVPNISNTPLPATPEVVMENHVKVHNLSFSDHALSNILLLIALCFHAVLQGIGFGIVISSAHWSLLIVLCSQQVIVVFVAGAVGLSNDRYKLTVMCFVTTTSVSCPLGIVLWIVLENAMTNLLVFGIAKGLLCGSLLYFTFYDILSRREMKNFRHLHKFIGFTLGTSVVTGIDYVSTII